ncbi:coiled-coil domain-containing protein 105-like [Salmo salar]|uniref:Coiled-coil domain-containing protein 105-like n=1 Tax=Salmo salar TaxID=8030 RepID=A0ABM3ETH0_SALSA|nr:coiled-coil domain-containing protein 105-like [Salmo salar]
MRSSSATAFTPRRTDTNDVDGGGDALCKNKLRSQTTGTMGPEYSGDILSREKLNRPIVKVYHRHPGTQLPEAAHLIQGSSVLRCCLLSSKEELSRLQGTCLQLVDNLHGKRAAEQVDSAVVRLLWSGCCGQAAAAAGRQTSNAHFPPTGVVLNSLCSA